VSLDIRKELLGSIHIFELSGRLDSENSPMLELAALDAMNADAKHLVMDLSAIRFISSAGLRVLLACAKKLEGVGTLRIVLAPGLVTDVFEKSGFSRLLQVYANRALALADHPSLQAGKALGDIAAQLMGLNSAQHAAPNADQNVSRGAAQVLGVIAANQTAAAMPKLQVNPAKADDGVISKPWWRRWFGF
jgi:anti-anti-sigma factor